MWRIFGYNFQQSTCGPRRKLWRAFLAFFSAGWDSQVLLGYNKEGLSCCCIVAYLRHGRNNTSLIGLIEGVSI